MNWRIKMKTLFATLVVALSSIIAQAASIDDPIIQDDQSVFRAYIDSTNQFVGGTITLYVEHNKNAGLTFTLDTVPHFNIIATSNDTSGNWWRQKYTLLALDTGEFELPVLRAEGADTHYQSYPGSVRISLIPQQGTVELAENRPNEIVPWNLWWWLKDNWIYLLETLVALGAIVYAVRKWRRSKRPVEKAEIIITPADRYAEALEQIKNLRKDKPWEEDPKAFYVVLGDVLRKYLEYRTGLPLMESTTTDALTLVHGKWTGAQIEAYEYLLTRADMVKFAKGTLDVSVHLDCLTKAEQLIQEFKPTNHD
jgi:hypothetical protein